MAEYEFFHEELRESLILSQLIRNVLYRDTVLTYIKPNFFEEPENQDLFKTIHSLVVKDNIQKLDKKTLRLKFENTEKLNEIFLMEDYPTENVEFLITITEKWGKERALAEAVIESVGILERNSKNSSGIGKLVEEALSFSFDRNLGLNYTKEFERRLEFYTRKDEKIKTGFVVLDRETFGGLPKKTLTVTAGSSGLGKTNFGTNIASNFLCKGMNGVYVTLELAEEYIARRVDSITTNMDYMSLSRRENAEEMVSKIEDKMKIGFGKFFIKEYPPSKACTLNIKTYLKELELIENVKPDFLIVDYIQLMKPNHERNGMNSFEKYKEVAEELRELASTLNIPVITFSQVKRDGYNSSDGDMTYISDSMGIVNTADLVIVMSHYNGGDEADKYPKDCDASNTGIQLWKIAKNRLGKVGKSFEMLMSKVTLKMYDLTENRDGNVDEDGEVKTKKKKDEKETNDCEEVLGTDTEELDKEAMDDMNKVGKEEEEEFKNSSTDWSCEKPPRNKLPD